MVKCNTTLEDEAIHETPLSIGITFHHLGLALSAAFALVSVIISLYLMFQHAIHYSKPWEQKHIIRILFMIPIFSLVSFLSYLYFKHAIYFEVLRDCYEAFAIAAFFSLLCSYIAYNVHDQKDYFRMQTPKNWVWPIPWIQRCTGGRDTGWLRRPHSGLTWFNVVWILVFQYCFIRVFFTFVAVISQATGRYCQNSLSPAFAHIWIEIIEAIGVTLAMYGIIQIYYQLRQDISEHRPVLKLACIKLVIFFSFWQDLVISFASTRVTPTPKLAYQDIKVGIPAMLVCIEMAIFSVLHIFAFPWKPYSIDGLGDPLHAVGSGYSGKPEYKGGAFGHKAFFEAFNPWDIVKASARGFRWLFIGRRYRHQDMSYQQQRQSHNSYDSNKLQPIGSNNGLGRPMTRDEPGDGPLKYSGGDLGARGSYEEYGTSYPRNEGLQPIPYGARDRDPSPGSFDRLSADGHSEDRTALLDNAGAPGTGVHPALRKEAGYPQNSFDSPRYEGGGGGGGEQSRWR